jgi:hypothetical protein
MISRISSVPNKIAERFNEDVAKGEAYESGYLNGAEYVDVRLVLSTRMHHFQTVDRATFTLVTLKTYDRQGSTDMRGSF